MFTKDVVDEMCLFAAQELDFLAAELQASCSLLDGEVRGELPMGAAS